jgi:hypothetical protein
LRGKPWGVIEPETRIEYAPDGNGGTIWVRGRAFKVEILRGVDEDGLRVCPVIGCSSSGAGKAAPPRKALRCAWLWRWFGLRGRGGLGRA